MLAESKSRTGHSHNLAPCSGFMLFARVDIDGRTGVMTVTPKNVDNLGAVDIAPQTDARGCSGQSLNPACQP
jgi:alkaline phosphatase D